MNIHPKTSAAAVGTAAGVLIAAILHSISGIHLQPEAYAAIPSFLGVMLSWLVPDVTPVTRNPQPPVPPAADARPLPPAP